DAAFLVVDRLMAGRQVDDAQAPHSERNSRLDEHAFIVRAAVADDVAHAVDERVRVVRSERRTGSRRFYEASDSTHKRSFGCGSAFDVRRKRGSVVVETMSSVDCTRLIRRVSSDIHSTATIGLAASRLNTLAIRSGLAPSTLTRTVVVGSSR